MHHNPYKHIFHSYLLFHCFILMPILLVVTIYSFGAMCLLGQWKFCLWMMAGLFISVFAAGVIAIFSE